LIKGIRFLLLLFATIEWILLKIFILAILRVLEIELFAYIFVSFDSDLPLRIIDLLINRHSGFIGLIFSGLVLLRILLISLSLIKFLDWDIVKFAHQFSLFEFLISHIAVLSSFIHGVGLLLWRHEDRLWFFHGLRIMDRRRHCLLNLLVNINVLWVWSLGNGFLLLHLLQCISSHLE
jgi:hypothetical protein